jgi:hypothetical protein
MTALSGATVSSASPGSTGFEQPQPNKTWSGRKTETKITVTKLVNFKQVAAQANR